MLRTCQSQSRRRTKAKYRNKLKTTNSYVKSTKKHQSCLSKGFFTFSPYQTAKFEYTVVSGNVSKNSTNILLKSTR